MLDKELSEGLKDLELGLGTAQQQLLLDYLTLLSRWNKTYNLTAVRDERAMVTRHLLDSLSVLPHLQGQRFIDVGTGAGLPGIPLAIAAPTRQFTLLDSNGKKTRFLVHASNELGLTNIEVVKSRVRDYKPTHIYDTVLSRAFASLDDMISSCQHLLVPGGDFLAMKGQHPDEELQSVESGSFQISTIDLQVPGLFEDRCLVRIQTNPDADRDK
ncbi:16S rRNA (guanine(527)-N(7))-methyltransferase RsmG [Congregibacter variabilis]|uniref:Ribosomal RNA small subunit methyltransferase G n=1 Tax=Congregibacter variabilis TaxID=3081200 RepID=A0ABZ0I077_9GAMM|nr:16S rRNA (guanine(527)-N(7))-methyltransferase RsmG [Congregibacter sp. IMCC43200]